MNFSITFLRIAIAYTVISSASMAFAQRGLPPAPVPTRCNKNHCEVSTADKSHKPAVASFRAILAGTTPTSSMLTGKEDIKVTMASQGSLQPVIVHNILSSDQVFTVYTKPLYTTAIRLPGDVSALVVGAPTLFEVEHAKGQPRLVFVKPSTHRPADSNLIIALASGAVVSIHLISPGDASSHDPVDFLVDYTPQHSLLLASLNGPGIMGMTPSPTPIAIHAGQPARSDLASTEPPSSPDSAAFSGGSSVVSESPLQPYLMAQEHIAAQAYLTGHDLARIYPIDKKATNLLGVAFGAMKQQGDMMTFAYSVINRSHKWIEVLPPEIQFQDPAKKRHSRKHPDVLAETIPIDSYLVSARKVGPGGRIDGVVRFERPSFKSAKQKVMLQLALADQIDKSILIPIPFVVAVTQAKESHVPQSRTK